MGAGAGDRPSLTERPVVNTPSLPVFCKLYKLVCVQIFSIISLSISSQKYSYGVAFFSFGGDAACSSENDFVVLRTLFLPNIAFLGGF